MPKRKTIPTSVSIGPGVTRIWLLRSKRKRRPRLRPLIQLDTRPNSTKEMLALRSQNQLGKNKTHAAIQIKGNTPSSKTDG